MTAENAINEVNAILPHNFPNELLLGWLTRIEQTAYLEIKGGELSGLPVITAEDTDKPLGIPDPYSVIYPLYLQCMVYLALGEYDRYANLYGVFNSAYSDYAKWVLRTGA